MYPGHPSRLRNSINTPLEHTLSMARTKKFETGEDCRKADLCIYIAYSPPTHSVSLPGSEAEGRTASRGLARSESAGLLYAGAGCSGTDAF